MRSLHLAIDAVGVKHSGGATILLDFIRTACKDQRISLLSLYCSPQQVRDFSIPALPTVRVLEQQRAEESYLHRVVWHEHLLGRACIDANVEVLLCMTGTGKSHISMPHVTFVQQSLPFAAEFAKIATLSERLRMTVLKVMMRSSCQSARQVIVQTPTMKRWVSRQLNLPPDRVQVIIPTVSPFGVVESSGARLLAPEDGPKVLYVGSEHSYKNVQTVLRGLARLRNRIPGTTLFLTWPTDHPASRQAGVVCLGYLSRAQIACAYSEATILVMPSLIETVGLPILEAMSAGVPVLAADRPYAHDIAEDAALFFDPLSAEDFAMQAEHLLQDDTLRRHLIDEGRALLTRRAQLNPYQQMLDIILNCARNRQTTS